MKAVFYISRIVFLLCAGLFCAGKVSAQWTSVGNVGFSTGFAFVNKLAFDSDNNLYVAYSDAGYNQRVVVKKLVSGVWTTLGTPGFAGLQGNQCCDMAISSDNVPYVAAIGGSNLQASVWKFNGTDWEMVGTEVSEEIAGSVSIALNSDDVPYLFYRDDHSYDGISSGKATVKKFNGSTWELVGSPAFSDDFIQSQDLAFDGDDVPYVAYEDGGHSLKGTVKKFNGTSWETVGVTGFTGGWAKFISLAIDSDNVPYLAFQDDGAFKRAGCYKYNGTTWVSVGPATGLSSSIASYTSLAIDESKRPLVAYRNESSPFSITVKKFDGTNWNLVGADNFSGNSVGYISLTTDTYNNPFVAFQDGNNGFRETVATFEIYDPLPVKLASFDGKYSKTEQAVLLNWTTAEELNNDRFEIESGITPREFRKIGEVKGTGTSSQKVHYSFADSESIGNPVYYRFKQIDLDGSFSYSRIISIQKPEDEGFYIAGNPVRGEKLHLHTDAKSSNPVNITVLSANGKMFGQWTLAGREELSINVKNLAAGMYILRYEDTSGMQSRKFVRE